jgi:hypothetical protein
MYNQEVMRKRNMQIYEIYRQVLIFKASVYAAERLGGTRNASLDGIKEAVGLMLHSIKQDRRKVEFQNKDGLYEFSKKYRLPVFKTFFYKCWQRRLTLLAHILTSSRSAHKYPYDQSNIRQLYPELSSRQRQALIRKDFERLKSWFPEFKTILKKDLTRLDLVFWAGWQDRSYCVSYRHYGDHLDLGIGHCDFADSMSGCCGRPSFCTRGGLFFETNEDEN